jgi:Sec-independent protein translocase protein TatA
MGQASKEFKKGIDEGEKPTDEDKPEKPEKKEDSA